jgi:Ca2+/Na+ antiporter
MARLNFFGNPYDWKESLKWIAKHLIIEIYYPLMGLFFLAFIVFNNPSLQILSYIFTPILFLLIALFIYRFWKRKKNKIENIGKYDDKKDKWVKGSCHALKKRVYTIGFVGDIMKMGKYKLKFDTEISRFFNDVDLVVGNLEGIITDKWPGITAQKHSAEILKQLTELVKPPQKWLLCTSNNHSSDFGHVEFLISQKKIRKKGFNLVGDIKHPSYSYSQDDKPEINIASGTMWNNQRNHCYVCQFDFINDLYQPDNFNILLPHWHFENEYYIRKDSQTRSKHLILAGMYIKKLPKWSEKLLKAMKNIPVLKDIPIINKFPINQKIDEKIEYLTRNQQRKDEIQKLKYYRRKRSKGYNIDLKKWDLIYGMHSHVPQPITHYKKRLLAYSGGNLTSSQWRKKHRSGLILKCELGQVDNSNRLVLGNFEWSYTYNDRKWNDDKVIVKLDTDRNAKKSFTNTKNRLFTHIIFAMFSLIFWSLLSTSILFDYLSIFLFILVIILILILCYYIVYRPSRVQKYSKWEDKDDNTR